MTTMSVLPSTVQISLLGCPWSSLLLLLLILVSFHPRSVLSEQLWKDVCNPSKFLHLSPPATTAVDHSSNDDNEIRSITALPKFCNINLPLKERVEDYVRQIPIINQINMMGNTAQGYEPLNIPPYQWWSEGLHGPLEPCVRYNDNNNNNKTWCRCPTSFPSPSSLGNAFNRTLYRMIGRSIGIEGRSISLLRPHDTSIGDGLTYWSPTINLQRDPRWGRNQEVPGEDPLLTSVYAAEFVNGLQQGESRSVASSSSKSSQTTTTTSAENNNKDRRIQIGACCKHFVANSLEDWMNVSRHNFDAHIDEEDLYNYYLPPFRECSKFAVGVMCSYNAINGIPSCVNPWLLKNVLRNDFQFDGYVVTDCGALADVVAGHHYAIDAPQASVLAKEATVDVNCGNGDFFPSGLQTAYEDGRINATTVTESFKRMATVQFRLGLFDGPQSFDPIHEIKKVGSSDHQQLALEAALQSIVLLQNKNHLLPISESGEYRARMPQSDKSFRLAVIGPHINATEALLSNYHGEKCQCTNDGARQSSFGIDDSQETQGLFGPIDHSWDCLVTPLDAIQRKMKTLFPDEIDGGVKAIQGCTIAGTTINEIDAAQKLALESDRIVMLLGIDNSQESEGLDRYNTTLPGLQTRLLDAVLNVADERTVIVLIHGGSMSLGQHVLDNAGAILSAGYGGEMASEALAKVLFGDYNPTGKLSATWYPPSYVDDIPLTEMGLRVGVGRTYLYYKGQAEFMFGHGLSYSLWDVQWDEGTSNVDLKLQNESESISLKVMISNVGPYAGKQTILLFWRPTESSSTSMKGLQKKLIGFAGTTTILDVGESESVELDVSWTDFSFWDARQKRFLVSPGNYTLELHVANSQILERNIIVGSSKTVQTVDEESVGWDGKAMTASIVQNLQMAMRLPWRN